MLWWALALAAAVVVAAAVVARLQRRTDGNLPPEVAPGPGLHTGEQPPTAADLSPEPPERD
jgi:hypothetical protein